uniref:Cilia and flagella associated protein 74 n=1 Tax=Leptobrachium leishanense TaxID=445787 RepID=A0A8C5MY74_9ANUR
MDITASPDILEEPSFVYDDPSMLEEEEILPDYLWTEDEEPEDNELTSECAMDKPLYEDSLDEISDSFDDDSSWQSEADPTDSELIQKNISHSARVQIYRFRAKLNQLDSMQRDKEILIQKLREELATCHQRIKTLEQQQTTAETDIQTEQENNNTAAVFRLHALHKRLSSEVAVEKDVESKIAVKLQENEYDLWKIEVEQGKLASLRESLEQDEEEIDRQREDLKGQRVQRENQSRRMAERKRQADKLREQSTLKDREFRYRKAVEDAQRNHAKAVQYLKETMTRVREQESEKEMKSREDMEKRMQAVLTLKTSISANRENLRAVDARNKARDATAKKQEMMDKESVLAKGGDATKFIIHQKRLQEFERKKFEFEEKQRTMRQEIISRILQEEANQEKQKKLSSSMQVNKSQDQSKLRIKTLKYIESAFPSETEEELETTISKRWQTNSGFSSDEEENTTVEQSPDMSPELYPAEESEMETLVQPEFMGLWNQDLKPYKVPKEERESKPLGGSKMEKEMLAGTLRKLRNGIAEKQVVSGHEFKGCPFYSKPNVIHFKDLDVGKTYKKKVTLTNASYTINFCKLVGINEHLKDFIKIRFDPPGQLSPGMSCEITVIFHPMINEDLDGEVTFLAQTGTFSIPVKCTTKKCGLAVEKECVDFGTQVVGETVTQNISLTNRGALGTRFRVQPLSPANGTQKATQEVSMETSPGFDVEGSKDREIGTSLESRNQDEKEAIVTNPPESVCESASPPSNEVAETRSADVKTSTTIEYVSKEVSTLTEETLNEEKSPLGGFEDEPPEIKLGEITEGDLGPFATLKIPFIFTPTFPAKVQTLFQISFTDQNSKPILVTATGIAIDVPVYVPNSNIDLKICTYNRLYQDSIIVKNRATTALRLKFDVCKELKNHMELLPKTGFIQAQSSFSVQLKFLPRLSLPEDAASYFDKETGVLEAPMNILVADQTRPVPFTVNAVLTTSDLEINPTEVDFGHCTIFEAVQCSIHLTNKSILPQEFGFVGIPEYVEIQPGDGFGTLFPLETLKLDIIFRAAKAKEYGFGLTCKSAINRQFKVFCKAVGVHPPLELSHSLVQFRPTAFNDVSTATLYIINSHTSRNEFTHPVPRIGKGEVAPVGPTSFEIHVPNGIPITVSPLVGTVLPGERCLVQVSFRPTLSDQEIREETVRIIAKANESRILLEKNSIVMSENEVQNKKEKKELSANTEKRKQTSSPKRERKKHVPSPKQPPKTPKSFEPGPSELPNIEDIKPESEEYAAAQASIYRRFTGKFEKFILPCFIASCDVSKKDNHADLNFSPYNTLLLELHCPTTAPPLIVTSDNGRHLVDFGDIATGQRVIKRVTLQNISLEHQKFFENLEVHTQCATLTLGIKGKGLSPSVSCSLESEILDMGHVLVKDSRTSTFQLQNTSIVPVIYTLKLGSFSMNRYNELQKIPSFISPDKAHRDVVGTQNYSGLSVFSVSPVEGTIEPGKSLDVTVTFNPDHETVYYSDSLAVELFGKHKVHDIQLKGACRNHIMYLEGSDPLDVPVESLGIIPAPEEEEALKTILVSFQCTQTEAGLAPAARDLRVGCIHSTLMPTKKNVEFTWDNVQLLQQKGFTIEPIKSMVDPGQQKTVSIRWIPPAQYDPSKPATTMAKLTLKGDVTEVYQVILATQVVSA